jgi:hypothetical protein
MPALRSFVRPTALFLLIIFALILLSGLPAPWAAWRPATCMPDACFCEAIGAGFIRQPIGTWSNLAFVLVGLLILADTTNQAHAATSSRVNSAAGSGNTLKRVLTRFIYQPSNSFDGQRGGLRPALRPAHGIIFALAVILIGLGSWFYHASLTFAGQWFDVMGMYLLGTFMVLYAAARLRPLSGRVFAFSYVLFNLVLAISLIVVPELRRYLFGVLLVVTIALEYRNRVSSTKREASSDRRNPVSPRLGYFIAALLIYLLAQIIWTLDLNHIVCDPYGPLQGHAVWHVLTALSAGLLYLYYRSEHLAPTAN